MSMIKFDPVRGFEAMSRKMNSLVNDFDKTWSFEFGGFSPRIDISENTGKIFIHAEIPGMAKEDIKITINDENVLVIKGEKKRELKPEEEADPRRLIRMERSFGEFVRSFLLPENVKKDNINAKFESGILYLELEKIEPEKPKEINIVIE